MAAATDDNRKPSTSARLALSQVVVVIPAVNEEVALARLLPELQTRGVGQIVVGENGSTDSTVAVAHREGAVVAYADRRGYGAACAAALDVVDETLPVVVFVDADTTDELAQLEELVTPVLADEADLVMGWRRRDLQRPGAMTPAQRFGTWLAVKLMWVLWGAAYQDLGPFRAIRSSTLREMRMQDRAFGWTVEMQVRAAEMGLRVREIPVPYSRRREGRSKISGTVSGVAKAGYWILTTIGRLYVRRWVKRRSR